MQTKLYDLVSNFVAMTTRSLLLKFDSHRWIACPREPPVRRKHRGDISYTRRGIGEFVLNFDAMAKGLVMVEFF